MSAGKFRVSIITVVFNDPEGLEKTILNVASQTYTGIEHIVIDGASKDSTIDVINKHQDKLSYWISEPDRGLYDAMNKGLKAAQGDYVWFMNAGDLIYKDDTTELIFRDQDQYADIYYGDTMVVDSDYREIGLRRLRPPGQLSWKSFQKGMLVCHQAILVKRELAGFYDERYTHSADFDWVIKALKKADKIRNTNMILAAFLDGGHSKQNIKPSLKERFHSMSRHYGFLPTLLRHIPIAFRFLRFYSREGRF
jgi:glycosyltransferase involved in cell wall biosynthesis